MGRHQRGRIASHLVGHSAGCFFMQAGSGAHRHDLATLTRPSSEHRRTLDVTRAQGMPGAGRNPWPACSKKRRRQSPQVQPDIRHPLRDGFHAYFAISPVSGLLATVARGDHHPGTWRQHRGARTTRLHVRKLPFVRARKHAAANPRPSPPRLACRDDRDTPLVPKQDGHSRAQFLEKRKIYFLKRKEDRRRQEIDPPFA
ncbi:MAG: hypothetical protein WA418_07455 [Bradyrhizobium sp.]